MCIRDRSYFLANPLASVATAGGMLAFGRLLASPRVARWIASAPRSPRAFPAHVAKLSSIARAEPALANEIGLLQRAANDNLANAGRAVASEGEGQQEAQNP